MADNTIYPKGVAEVTVPASQKIAISNYGGGIAQIYYLITAANQPPAYQLQQTLENSAVTLGAFTSEQKVKINANNSTVVYEVGASPSTGIGDADTLNGLASDTAAIADTIVARDSSGDITANAFESTVATGTAPLTVASTTLVANLNADTVDGIEGSNIAKLDSTNTFTENQKIQNTVIGGVPPDTLEDDLVLENTSAGITITSANTGFGSISFGDSDAKRSCRIIYSHSSDEFYMFINEVNVFDFGTDRIVNFNETPTVDGDEIWHAGNTATQYMSQGAPTAKTTDDTLTAAEIDARIITVNQGAAGTSTQTLPLATAMDSYFTGVADDFGFEFTVINISTVAGEDAIIATNTGWTLVGEMTVEANDSDRANSSGRLFARKTGTGTWTLYRLA